MATRVPGAFGRRRSPNQGVALSEGAYPSRANLPANPYLTDGTYGYSFAPEFDPRLDPLRHDDRANTPWPYQWPVSGSVPRTGCTRNNYSQNQGLGQSDLSHEYHTANLQPQGRQRQDEPSALLDYTTGIEGTAGANPSIFIEDHDDPNQNVAYNSMLDVHNAAMPKLSQDNGPCSFAANHGEPHDTGEWSSISDNGTDTQEQGYSLSGVETLESFPSTFLDVENGQADMFPQSPNTRVPHEAPSGQGAWHDTTLLSSQRSLTSEGGEVISSWSHHPDAQGMANISGGSGIPHTQSSLHHSEDLRGLLIDDRVYRPLPVPEAQFFEDNVPGPSSTGPQLTDSRHQPLNPSQNASIANGPYPPYVGTGAMNHPFPWHAVQPAPEVRPFLNDHHHMNARSAEASVSLYGGEIPSESQTGPSSQHPESRRRRSRQNTRPRTRKPLTEAERKITAHMRIVKVCERCKKKRTRCRHKPIPDHIMQHSPNNPSPSVGPTSPTTSSSRPHQPRRRRRRPAPHATRTLAPSEPRRQSFGTSSPQSPVSGQISPELTDYQASTDLMSVGGQFPNNLYPHPDVYDLPPYFHDMPEPPPYSYPGGSA
ncbi:MAG: hypothetical protein Q9164_005201 [Protoblastenia rupestris]